MKCPHCGSEHIQYATKISGGGLSFGESCCGYILLGPLGLLCGACGSGTTTEEFWVCQNCGKKFSSQDAKQQERTAENDKAKLLQYKEELSAVRASEGDFGAIRNRLVEATQRQDNAEKTEGTFLKDAKNSSDPTMAKLAKAGGLTIKLAGVLFVLSVLTLFIFSETTEIALILFVAAIALVVAWSMQTDEARKKLMEYNQEFDAIASETDAAKQETKRLKNLVEKIDFVERHQRKE